MYGLKEVTGQGNRFVETIHESDQILKKARRGISVFGEPTFEKSLSLQSLPLFESDKMVDDLNHYLDLSVAKATYSNQLEDGKKAKIVQLVQRVKPKPENISTRGTNSHQKSSDRLERSKTMTQLPQ